MPRLCCNTRVVKVVWGSADAARQAGDCWQPPRGAMRCCMTAGVGVVSRSMCYNKDRAVSPARLVRGLIGAHNGRPHGDSKVPPYSVKARLGLMRSALAGVHCDQREDRV